MLYSLYEFSEYKIKYEKKIPLYRLGCRKKNTSDMNVGQKELFPKKKKTIICFENIMGCHSVPIYSFYR